jgi:glycosyltransferase involved in cell wall biosynthesis
MIVKPNFCRQKSRRKVSANTSCTREVGAVPGRLAPDKDVGTLMQAWRSIREPLTVVGDGPQREALQRMALTNVEFRDTVTADGVAQLLQGARALLLPTRCSEGGPRAVIGLMRWEFR